jgi:hypothetical protein
MARRSIPVFKAGPIVSDCNTEAPAAAPLSEAIQGRTSSWEALVDTAAAVHSTPRVGVSARILVFVVGLLTVALFFRYQILTRFTLLNGDRYDQIIEVSILEHWYNTFRGLAHWSETDYFYPFLGTLGYNDGFFLYGAIFSIFRSARLDPYLSGECVNVVMQLVAYFGFYLAGRRLLELTPGWASLGAVLFALSNNIFVGAHHAQMLGVAFAPVMAVLLDGALAALLAGRRAHLLAWGIAAACLYAAWLMTTAYMAWYFLFFCSFAAVSYVVLAGRAGLRPLWAAGRQQAVPLAVILLVLVAAVSPFAMIYLPKAHETGMHSYREAQIYTLSLPDLLYVGEGNLLYGRVVAFVNHLIRSTPLPASNERLTGFPPGLLLLFAAGAGLSLAAPRAFLPAARATALRALAVASLVTWVLAFNLDGHSAWWFIYELFPGAQGPRVVARYQIFLAAPVVAIAVLYLSTRARRVAMPLVVLICGLLVAEEINTEPHILLDREHELARLHAVPLPPTGCKAFVTSTARLDPPLGGDADSAGYYSHNVDAMMIAETLHLPTINGLATFLPPNWNLKDPDHPDYLDKIRRYAAANHVTDLCSLDLQTMQWDRFDLQVAPVGTPTAPGTAAPRGQS